MRIHPSLSLWRTLAAPAATRPATRAARYTTATTTTTTPTPTPSAARAAQLAAVEAVTESDSAQPGAQDPLRPAHAAPSKSKALKNSRTVPFTPATQPQMPLAPPRYHVARSANRNLPVYTDYKRGGNLHLTTVRKITGDLHALRDELRAWLAKKDEDVKINPLTQHVIVKGHHAAKVAEFLKGRGF